MKKNNFSVLRKKYECKIILSEIIPATIICGYYLVYFIFLFQRSQYWHNYVLLAIGLISVFFIKKIGDKEKKYLLFCLIMLIFNFTTLVVVKNREITSIFVLIQYLALGLLLINRKISTKIVCISFSFYVLFFLICIFGEKNPNQLFLEQSENTISTFMLIQCCMIYIANFKNQEKSNTIPALLTMLISFWAGGRSGCIASFVLFFLIFVLNIFRGKMSLKRMFLFGGGGIILLGILSKIYSLFFNRIINRIIVDGVSDPWRKLIWNAYLSGLNAKDLLFGKRVIGDYVLVRWDLNVHNSFLQLHMDAGMGGICTIGIATVVRIIKCLKRKEFIILIMLLTIYIRIFTDIHAFFNYLDPIIYYLLFNEEKKEVEYSD